MTYLGLHGEACKVVGGRVADGLEVGIIAISRAGVAGVAVFFFNKLPLLAGL